MENRKRNRNAFISFLYLGASMLLCFLAALFILRPENYTLQVGDTAPTSIYAPRDVVDRLSSLHLQEQARNNTPPVYAIDPDRLSLYTREAERYFENLEAIRTEAYEILARDESRSGTSLTASGWLSYLSDRQKTEFMARNSPNLTENQLGGLLGASNTEYSQMKEAVLPQITRLLAAGFTQDNADSIRDSVKKELDAQKSVGSVLKSIGSAAIESFLQPSFGVDEEATRLAREAAAAGVTELVVKKGEALVLEGARISLAQMNMLKELGLIRERGLAAKRYVGVFLSLFVSFVLFISYLVFTKQSLLRNSKKMLLLCILFLLVILLRLFTFSLSAYISFAVFAVMLASLMIDEELAIAFSLLLGAVTGLLCDGSRGVLDFDALALAFSTFASGIATVYALRKTQNRNTLISAGLVGGGVGALTVLTLCLMEGQGIGDTLSAMGWTLGSAILSGLLVVGSMPVWERLFDVATSTGLRELLNANHPLLKQLMNEAPGTYQHSMNVSLLSEAAAEAVGADPVLCRVSGSFHDVGKLKRPSYFAENQKDGVNIHDTLPPIESASIIISHVKDGVTLLNKHRLPSAVIRVVAEHHGDSLVSFFYHKSLQKDPNTQKRGFRYPFSRPSSRESVIVMLADCCEAAVRSLGDCSREAREEMVHKVIWSKFTEADGQLTNAPFTLEQISSIEKSFNKTFSGMRHERPEYPDMEKKA